MRTVEIFNSGSDPVLQFFEVGLGLFAPVHRGDYIIPGCNPTSDTTPKPLERILSPGSKNGWRFPLSARSPNTGPTSIAAQMRRFSFCAPLARKRRRSARPAILLLSEDS